MSKISRESAPDVTDNGPAEDRGAYRRLRRHLHLDPSGLGPHAAAQRGRRATAARAHTGNMSRRGASPSSTATAKESLSRATRSACRPGMFRQRWRERTRDVQPAR